MNNRYREEEKEENAQNTENEQLQTESEDVVEPEVIENENNSDQMEEHVSKLEEEIKRLNDLYLRTLADTENYKKRINDERIRERKYATQNLLEKFVGALDVFDKAVNIKTDDEKLKNFLVGFEMVNNMMKQIIEDEGVKKLQSLGVKFNPTYHHAVETAYDENQEEDIILEEFQSGYTFKDRVLRPALVKVNKKNKEENK